MKAIYIAKINGKTKDNRPFTAWETTDTKDKTRLSVAFVQDKCTAPEESCFIEVLDGFIDKRKRFPVLRVRAYKVIEKAEKKDTLSEYFD